MIKGISWMSGFRISTRLISIVRIAILARILSPVEFGLYGIALLVLAFIEILTETGINFVLMQEEKKLEEIVDTAWILSIARGLVIGLIIFISAPYVASFFNASSSLPLILGISIVPIIKGFINPAEIKFQQQLEFNKEFFFRFVIFLVDSLVAITVALITYSAFSLIVGLIMGAITEVILSFLLIKPIPCFRFNKKIMVGILHKGKWLTLAGIFNYLFQHLDDIVVGKVLGVHALGLYDAGYKLSLVPITEVGDVVSKVTFPIYVKIGGDIKRLRTAYMKTVGGITLLVVPLGVLFFIFPEPIISILLGEKWISAAPALKVLALFGMIRAILNSASPVFFSIKKQKYVTVITLVGFISLALCIYPLITLYGIVGAAFAALIATLVTVPVISYYLYKELT